MITITELSETYKLDAQAIRILLSKNNIEPIDKVRRKINGFKGFVYPLSESEKAIKDKLQKIEVPKIIKKKYTGIQICDILRNDVKHYLNNKQVKDWNNLDWKEFNKIHQQ